jgi:hypothetical protein
MAQLFSSITAPASCSVSSSSISSALSTTNSRTQHEEVEEENGEENCEGEALQATCLKQQDLLQSYDLNAGEIGGANHGVAVRDFA